MQRARKVVLVLLLGCSPEYELLRGPGAGGSSSGGEASGGGSIAGSGDVGGTGAAGFDSGGSSFGGSLDAGGTGSGGESFAGASFGGSLGAGGTASGGTGFGGACANHVDCGAGTVCNASQCVACPEAPASCAGPCDHGFQPVLAAYNGCEVCECAPVSACSRKADCDADQECYPGAQCEPGCSDPSCCRGNRCAAAGCAGLPIPHCVAAGCAGGAVCLAACDAVTCECDGTAWQCARSPSTGGASSATCPQACVSP